MSNLVEILITAKDLTGPAMASVNAKANGASKSMATFHKTALLAELLVIGEVGKTIILSLSETPL